MLDPCTPSFSPSRRVLASSALVVLLASAGAALTVAQGSRSIRFSARDASRMLVGSADTNGNGKVSMEEREAFLARHAPLEDAALDRDAFLALALQGYLDDDGDRAFRARDLTALLERWDADASGDISAAERASGPGRRSLLDGAVLNGLDANLDGAISAEEWSATESLDLAAWLGAAARIPEDANAFGPGTMVLTLRASLDANTDGAFRRDDVVKIFSTLDVNGDGVIEGSELSTPAPTRGPDWSITEEERKRPPAMPWQRSLEDALALSKATGKPLLICVNTDGEAASENLAFGRYRDPEFVELIKGFVPLLACPNMHTQRTVDSRGQRMECPRFGRIICSEHIDEEPVLFERYFAGQRIAPRHVGVSPDGTVLFDLVLLQDLAVLDSALKAYGNHDWSWPDPATLETAELLESTDSAARAELAERFKSASTEVRLKLAALSHSPTRAAQHPAVLSLALFDASPLVRSTAAVRVTDALSESYLDYAPRVRWIAHDDASLRRQLIAKLHGLAESTGDLAKQIRARRLARIFAALELPPTLDARRWRIAMAGAPAISSVSGPGVDAALDDALAELDVLLNLDRNDPDANTLLAKTTLRKAERAISGEASGNPLFFLQDAEAAAERALKSQPGDVQARATLARAKWLLGTKVEEAADEAARALPELAGWADAPLTGVLLDVLAKSRTRTLYPALGTEEGWPQHWLVEAVDAYEVLMFHPACTEAQALTGVALFENLEDYRGQERILRAALRRFPASSDLHAWLRWQVLRDGDGERAAAAALEEAYTDLEAPIGGEAAWLWYEGLARFVAAETFIQQGEPAAANRAYGRGIESFEASIALNAGYAESANPYIERARAALEAH